jgi:hypothetical protein
VSLLLPHDASSAFTPLFTELDASIHKLGVVSYGLSIPTLQEVFLKITAEAEAATVAANEAQAHAQPARDRRAWPWQSKQPNESVGVRSAGERQPADAGNAPPTRSSLPPVAGEDEDGTPPLRTPSWAKQMRMGLVQVSLLMSDMSSVFFLIIPAILIFLLFLIPPLLDSSDPPVAANLSDAGTLPLTLLSFSTFPTTIPLPFAPPTGPLQTELLALDSVAAEAYSPEGLTEALRDASTGAAGAVEVESPSLNTLYHNASYEASLPVALHALDSAVVAIWAPGVTLATYASLLPYTGDNPPPLPSFVGAAISPTILIYAFILIGMISVTNLVKDRLVDKTTHQQVRTAVATRRWLGPRRARARWFCLFWR